MSRAPFPYKREALKLDPKARSEKHVEENFGVRVEQWRIYNAAGEIIGWSDPRIERSSGMAWMRAYYQLGGTGPHR